MHYVTAGESHGKALVTVVSSVPAGVSIDGSLIDKDLARRQVGYGRGGRMRIESDRALIVSGVRFGKTIGSPVAFSISNKDWDNRLDVMAVNGPRPDGSPRVTAPRPGHADLPGSQKTNTDDVRDILERASARETASRVAAGAVAKALLAEVGVKVESYVERIGSADCVIDPETVDIAAAEASDVRCPDPVAARSMRASIDAAASAGESLGGVFVVRVTGLVPGVGGYAEASQRLDARLGGALLSIPAIKGVEFGDGFASAARVGSQVHDPIIYVPGAGITRESNHAGGLEGGMTNGQTLVARVAMKPIPTLMKPLASVDIDTLQPIDASRERSDVCAVPAAAVVAEAEVALVLAAAYMDKFGHDCVEDIRASLDAYRERIAR